MLNRCNLETYLNLDWEAGLNVGTVADMRRRLEALLPPGWFPYPSFFTGQSLAPILDGALTGASTVLSFIYYLLQYARRQTRIRSMSGGWLDLASYDFFNYNLLRQTNEQDGAFETRIVKEFLRIRNTRQAVLKMVLDITGRAPLIVEPWNPTDCGVWDGPSSDLIADPLNFTTGSWTTNTTLTANAASAPDGTMTAWRLAETAVTSQHFLFQSIPSAQAGVTYVASFVLKAAERTQATIAILNNSVSLNAVVDLETGAILTSTTGTPVTSASLGNGWWRFSFQTIPAVSGVVIVVEPGFGLTFSYLGVVGYGIYVDNIGFSPASSWTPAAWDASGSWGEDPYTNYTYGPSAGAGYGEQPMIYQSFVTCYRPTDGRTYSDAMLIAAVERVRAEGTIIWMKILDAGIAITDESGAFIKDESGNILVAEQS